MIWLLSLQDVTPDGIGPFGQVVPRAVLTGPILTAVDCPWLRFVGSAAAVVQHSWQLVALAQFD